MIDHALARCPRVRRPRGPNDNATAGDYGSPATAWTRHDSVRSATGGARRSGSDRGGGCGGRTRRRTRRTRRRRWRRAVLPTTLGLSNPARRSSERRAAPRDDHRHRRRNDTAEIRLTTGAARSARSQDRKVSCARAKTAIVFACDEEARPRSCLTRSARWSE